MLAVVTAAMTQLSSRRARGEGHRPGNGQTSGCGWVSAGVFALCTLISVVNPDLGLYGLLILVVVRGMGINWIEADAVSQAIGPGWSTRPMGLPPLPIKWGPSGGDGAPRPRCDGDDVHSGAYTLCPIT